MQVRIFLGGNSSGRAQPTTSLRSAQTNVRNCPVVAADRVPEPVQNTILDRAALRELREAHNVFPFGGKVRDVAVGQLNTPVFPQARSC